MRHREQTFGTDAAAAALSVLGTLAVVTLVLPNFALGAVGPYYSAMQLLFVGVVSVSLYAVFLFVQTIRHREYFLDAAAAGTGDLVHDTPHDTPHAVPSNRITSASVALLALSLVGVVLLAKTLSPALERAIAIAGLPPAFSGVVIAAIVLMPESIAAVRSARANRLQSSLNLALGSALATIGLTIPIVGIAALWLEQPLALGIGAAETVLLLLTLFISTVTLATGRTTILQGAVHLVIFAVFMLLAIVQ
jgi:Ca2+:H+ antiporter